MESQIKSIVKDSKFYEDNDNCPTCSQPIEPEFKKQKIHECKTQATSIKTQYDNMLNEAQDVLDLIEEWNGKAEEIRSRQSEINGNNKTIESLQNQVNKTQEEIEKLTSREGDLGKANEELQTMMNDRDSLLEAKLTLNEDISYNNVMGELLKDTGIKTKVIKQYVPVINKLVNQYLQVLDFFVHFNLDDLSLII